MRTRLIQENHTIQWETVSIQTVINHTTTTNNNNMIIRRTDVNLQKQMDNMGMDIMVHLSKLNLELLLSRMIMELVEDRRQSSRASRRLWRAGLDFQISLIRFTGRVLGESTEAKASSSISQLDKKLTLRRGFQFVAMVVGKLSSVLWHPVL